MKRPSFKGEKKKTDDLLDVAAVVGAVGDSVAGDVVGSWHPAHPQHTVGDRRKLHAHRRWKRDCGSDCRVLCYSLISAYENYCLRDVGSETSG